MKAKLTASSLRIVLAIALALTIGLIIGVFMFGYSQLQVMSHDTQQKIANAEASENSLANLQRLKAVLDQESTTIDALKSIRSTSSFPQFDTEKSLRSIADSLNIPIANITFVNEEPSQRSNSSSSPTTATPTNKNSKISFTFTHAISYQDLIWFLQAIEKSSPKLQLSNLSVSPDSNGSTITVNTLTLEVAIAE